MPVLCDSILDSISSKFQICNYLLNNHDRSKEQFCTTLFTCASSSNINVYYDDDDDHIHYNTLPPSNDNKNNSQKNETIAIDCDTLTSCEWEGMHKGFIGDGVCHDYVPGCYNHPICKYDGGDCCQDTCQGSTFSTCGSDGYACRDPNSENCDFRLTNNCIDQDDNDRPNPIINCTETQTPYRLNMYDSFGDGWDNTVMYIQKSKSNHDMNDNNNADNTDEIIFQGSLKSGSMGTEYICLSKESTCYSVKLSGGMWGNEVSWDITPLKKVSIDVANGGAPMSCEFPIGGDACERTCNGTPSSSSSANFDKDDPKYKSYKELEACIESKCVIQHSLCQSDVTCINCLQDAPPPYCWANANYNALTACTLCSCMNNDNDSSSDGNNNDKEAKKSYCNPGNSDTNPDSSTNGSDKKQVPVCSGNDVIKGTNAVTKYHECSNIDILSSLVTNFDNDNFGFLDSFEQCATSFRTKTYEDITALGCLRILVNAIDTPAAESNSKVNGNDNNHDDSIPREAISHLAYQLYHNGESFCDCSKASSDLCPICRDFLHFKTLLYESLDGCRALDDIDCDAWLEFSGPCKKNLELMFGKVDFTAKEQCDYVHSTCGNVGPFPSFRKLDCDQELPKESWDLYLDFTKKCVGEDNDNNNSDKNKKSPTRAPTKPFPSPVTPYIPSSDDENNNSHSKPYISPEERQERTFLGRMLKWSFILGSLFF
jgi:hypothetical protein